MKLLILSDIHANWSALEAVLHNKGSWDGVAFCGNVVGVGPQPVFTLVNPGSVGLSHEASGDACYAVFDGDRVTLKRVTFELARGTTSGRDGTESGQEPNVGIDS
jgi:predicted phosphodiesterase